jgi:hypothetical protein
MINPKKQVEKHFNNNPPIRELHKNKVARQNETEIQNLLTSTRKNAAHSANKGERRSAKTPIPQI